MGYRIVWMSCSQWAGTDIETHEDGEKFASREEAEKALKDMQADTGLMEDVHAAAVEAQGVEGWLKIVKSDDA